MSYNFKKFKEVKGKFEDRISITGSYSFGLPSKFYEDNNIQDFDYVELYYDEEKRAIAFHFINDETRKNKFSVNHYRKYGGNISARSFFRAHNINPSEYKGKYEWKERNLPDIGEVFIIELTKKNEKG